MRVVVPPAVAVVVYPCKKLFAEIFLFASNKGIMLAVGVALTPVPVGIPLSTGVVMVGVVPKTSGPEPVSSEITPASCAEVVAPTFVLFNAPIAMLAVPSKDVPPIVLAVWSLGADTTVITGVVVCVATVAFASADETLVTVPVPGTIAAISSSRS